MTKSRLTILVVLLVSTLLLGTGAYYLFSSRTGASPSLESEIEEMENLSSSDEIEDIEQDIDNTELQDLDRELSDIESEINTFY